MRVGVIGGGIAGSLLAWRLRRARPDVCVDLWSGTSGKDATARSGGLVRGFEPDPVVCRLAVDSLIELLRDPRLRRHAGYRRTGSVYLTRGDHAEAFAVVSRLGRPGADRPVIAPAAALAPAHRLCCREDGVVAVVEPEAGYLSPDSLRVYAQHAFRVAGGTVVPAAAAELVPRGETVAAQGHGVPVRHYDTVVVAAGAHSARLLAASRLPPVALRTKLIQYQLYPVTGDRPPAFVDEVTGLYGRPYRAGAMLLGIPTDRWDVDPAERRPVPRLAAETERAARLRLPQLRLGPPARTVVGTDAYPLSGQLCLRTVAGAGGRVHTFTGGGGGAAKTALAASARAAAGLLAAVVGTIDGSDPGPSYAASRRAEWRSDA